MIRRRLSLNVCRILPLCNHVVFSRVLVLNKCAASRRRQAHAKSTCKPTNRKTTAESGVRAKPLANRHSFRPS